MSAATPANSAEDAAPVKGRKPGRPRKAAAATPGAAAAASAAKSPAKNPAQQALAKLGLTRDIDL
ncbi:MAG: hypothetical protein LBE58_01740, partial [Comamonas sp.]|nr:hypothetical protein [Comamonas sp.]